MPTKTMYADKRTIINIPLSGLKCLNKNKKNGKAICEIDVALLNKANRPNMIDLMVAEARAEYKTGKTRGFSSAQELLDYLNS